MTLWEVATLGSHYLVWGGEEPDEDGDLMDCWIDFDGSTNPYFEELPKGKDYIP